MINTLHIKFRKIIVATWIVIAWSIICTPVSAQTTLDLQQAIEIGLNQHYGIQIAENIVDQAKILATKVNVGMLPNVDLNSNATYTLSNTNQVLANDTEINRTGSSNINAQAGIALHWTLFDGKKMSIALDRYQALAQYSEVQLKSTVEEHIYNTIVAYLRILSAQDVHKLLILNKGVYDERVKLATQRLAVGSSSKTELLQAQIDKQLYDNTVLKQDVVIKSLFAQLNLLLRYPSDSLYNLSIIEPWKSEININDCIASALSNNSLIREASYLEQIAALQTKTVKANNRPQLDLNTGLNYSFNKSQASFLLSNQNYGPFLGLQLNWNVFDFGKNKGLIKHSQLEQENAHLRLLEYQESVQQLITTSWLAWNEANQILSLQEKSVELSKEHVDIVLERYRLQEANILELKDAQQTYEQHQLDVALTNIQRQIAYVDLMRLAGKITELN